MYMKLVPIIFHLKEFINKNSEKKKDNVISPISILQRSLRKGLYQEDQYDSFISKDLAKDFACLNEPFYPMSCFKS